MSGDSDNGPVIDAGDHTIFLGKILATYLNSDKNKLIVAYRVFDPKKQDFIVVDSEGKLFDIEKL
jgi:flavin reductase (DIM6/NTAB) family NADH-FMN oxidoreductase RutF